MKIIFAILIALLLIGCSESMSPIAPQKDHEVVLVNKQVLPTVTISGTVRYIDISGGFYGIVTNNGENIYPMNLPTECQQDGFYASFTGSYVRANTLVMWGQPFMINKYKEQ